MTRIILAALAVLPFFATQASAQYAGGYTQANINIIGRGCTTAFYWDPLCKPCGTGMKSSGIYPVTPMVPWNGTGNLSGTTLTIATTTSGGPLGAGAVVTDSTTPGNIPANTVVISGTPSSSASASFTLSASVTTATGDTLAATPANTNSTAWWTGGDMPDGAPNDPFVCTTAQWVAASWGGSTWNTTVTSADNAVMVNYLSQNFGWANTSNIYYVSNGDAASGIAAGTSGSGAVNDPSQPYMTMAGAYNALKTVASTFSGGDATFNSGSHVITITCPVSCTGTLGKGSLFLTGTALGTNTYIVSQLMSTAANRAAGTAGTYFTTTSFGSTVSTPEAVTAGYQPGGVIVVAGTNWASCTSSTPTTPCLSFIPCATDGGNPCWQASGSDGHPLVILAFPGEAINVPGYTDVADWTGGNAPYAASCCLRISGFQFLDTLYDHGSEGAFEFEKFADITFDHDEFAGWDKVFFSNDIWNVTLKNDVFHDMAAHSVYFGSFDCNHLSSAPGTDTNFAQVAADFVNGAACAGTYNARVIDSIFYNAAGSCCGGGDTLHYNTWMDGGLVAGNIISYSGQPVGFQTSEYNVKVSGNLMFDNNKECILQYDYANNIATATASGTTLNVSAITQSANFSGNNGLGLNDMVAGTGIPADTTITAIPAGSSPTGNYTLSNAATIGGSETVVSGQSFAGPATQRWNSFTGNTCWAGSATDTVLGGNPSSGFLTGDLTGISYIKGTVIQNNTIVTSNNHGTTDAGIPFQWEDYNGYPEATNMTGNTLYSIGPVNDPVMWLQDAGVSTVLPSGYYNFAGGTGCSSSSASFNSCFSGNTFAASNPLPGASESYVQTPGLFSFTPLR